MDAESIRQIAVAVCDEMDRRAREREFPGRELTEGQRRMLDRADTMCSMNTLELVRARLLTLSLAEVQAVAKAVDAPWPTVYKFRNEVTKDPSYTLVERLRIHFGIPAEQAA